MVRYLFYTIGDLTYQSPLVSAVCHTLVAICFRKVPASKDHSREQLLKFLVTFISNYDGAIGPHITLELFAASQPISCTFPILPFDATKPELLTTSLNGRSVIVSSHQTNTEYTASSHEMTRNHVG